MKTIVQLKILSLMWNKLGAVVLLIVVTTRTNMAIIEMTTPDKGWSFFEVL